MLIQSDAFNLPYKSKTFHACVTSPPYWGLRKYAGDQGEEPLGLEATPERHIERMVEVFREVRRVLRDDGVVWLNYGDCFAGSGKGAANYDGPIAGKQKTNVGSMAGGKGLPVYRDAQAGNLMLMPHRLAIALQQDGWIVRNDLVWFKRNPMPESVAGWRWTAGKPCGCATDAREKYIAGVMEEKGMERHRAFYEDGGHGKNWAQPDCPKCHGTGKVGEPVLRKSSWRHTRAHEYVFQLVKKMGYFCNQEVVREVSTDKESYEGRRPRNAGQMDGDDPENYKFHGSIQEDGTLRSGQTYPKRNPRSVLDVPTAPYKGAHYATFPPKLIAPLIRASVPRRCCPECGQAWAPVVEKGNYGDWSVDGHREDRRKKHGGQAEWNEYKPATVTDYRPTCECGVTEHKPGIVLDIFGGSGTTGMVAKQLLRRWVVMDISRPYLDEQAKVRTGTGTPSKALEGLPMFEEEDDEQKTN